MTFIPTLAREIGVSYLGVGLIGMCYGLASFFSYYIFGRFSDLTGRKKIFIKTGFLVCCVTFLAQLFMKNVFTMALIRGIAGFSLGIFSFPLIAYVSELPKYESKIGWLSGFGALGWFFGNLLAGIIGVYQWIFILSGFIFSLAFLASLFLPKISVKGLYVPPLPLELIKANSGLYLSYFIRHVGAHSVWAIFPLFLSDLGANKLWIGFIFALNPLTQFLTMWGVGKLSEKINEKIMIRVGLTASLGIFTLYSFASTYIQIIPIQILMGAGWSFLYVGSLIYLLRRNVERGASTGLLGSVMSLSAAVGPLLGGLISQFYGMRGTMYFALITTVIGIILSKRL
jgi:MFS family permease